MVLITERWCWRYCVTTHSTVMLQLNASDDRGIAVVREQIKEFASSKTMFQKTYKLVILDEADNMTADAQNALRRGTRIRWLYSS